MIHQRGFTLVELVAIITILGILAFTAIPRFFDQSSVDARGFYDQVKSVIRYAQKIAIASRDVVYINVATDTIRVCYDKDCNNPIPDPANIGNHLVINVPDSVTIVPPNTPIFGFNALGRPVTTALAPLGGVQIIQLANRTIFIEPETGYVHP